MFAKVSKEGAESDVCSCKVLANSKLMLKVWWPVKEGMLDLGEGYSTFTRTAASPNLGHQHETCRPRSVIDSLDGTTRKLLFEYDALVFMPLS